MLVELAELAADENSTPVDTEPCLQEVRKTQRFSGTVSKPQISI
jgi:hypothetical protein